MTLSDFAQVVGVLGGVIVLAGYFILTKGMVTAENRSYHTINLIGAILLMFSLVFKPNIGSIVIEVFFIILAAMGITRAKKW